MKTAILASLIATAAAFAPAQDAARTTVATNMAFENELGAQQPLGFFDPLGLVKNADQAKFDRLRATEIKHGRICMLGVVGYLTTAAGYRLPGLISLDGTKFSDIPSGWEGSTGVPAAGALQVFIFCAFLETAWIQDKESFPGDFSATTLFPVGWIADYDEETKLRKRGIELNQGRAAQMGMLALMVHDKLGNVEDFFPGQYSDGYAL